MAYDRQAAVSTTIPCRIRDASFSVWGGSETDVRGLLMLDMDGAKLSVGPSKEAVHLRNRMVDAKRKACGRIRIVIDVPVKDVRIGDITGV